jgi:sec-independent protein translocase protein TatC
MSNGQVQREEDLFAHTRMDLGSHIEELRGCLWRALKWFLMAMVVGVLIAQPVLKFIEAPLVAQLQYHKKLHEDKVLDDIQKGTHGDVNEPLAIPVKIAQDELREKGLPAPEGGITVNVFISPIDIYKAGEKIRQAVSPDDGLVYLSILDGIFAWLKVAMYCGIVLAAPLIFYEIWTFVAAGLYPQEKALVYRSLPLCIGLFVAGVALCQFLLLPLAINYLLGFNAWLGLRPELRLNDWLSFAIFTPIIFGIAFQTPLVMFVLDRIGILSVDLYIKHWRIATFIILVLSAFMAPAPDPVSMMALGTPVLALYWLGILMCKWWPRPKVDLDVEEPEEAVEV